MKKNILLTATLLTAPFFLISKGILAQCVATQDCASLGYSTPSNTGNCLKCPFGEYWSCPSNNSTCDTSYQYTCSGSGYSGGSGNACGGKYKSCVCDSDYSWNGSSCIYNNTSDSSDGGDYDNCRPGPATATVSCSCSQISEGLYKLMKTEYRVCDDGYSDTYEYSSGAFGDPNMCESALARENDCGTSYRYSGYPCANICD